MSGTSADGVDAAIIDLGPRGIELLAFDIFPFSKAMRKAIFRLFDQSQARVDEICAMNFAIGEHFAASLISLAKRNHIPLDSINLIGSHGQTIWHEPSGRRIGSIRTASTLQIGEPCVIAERTGITTIADFRTRDIAAGGQGAPLVPFADLVLFGSASRTRVLQNIGGIANLTYLPRHEHFRKRQVKALDIPDEVVNGVIAFDTGPGNMIIDRLVSLASQGREAFDRDGRLASKGAINAELLASLMRHKYLRRQPPKTTGREMFGRQFTDSLYAESTRKKIALADLIATATAFTACSIAQAYKRLLPAMPDEIIICGGGARNPTLMDMLRRQAAPAKVMVMDELGVNADAKEAISFAILAAATVKGLPSNVPAATGAGSRVVLGKIVPGRR